MDETKERAILVYERLKMLLESGKMDDLQEFTKGGISACCVILGIVNPYTGRKYVGDLSEF